MLGAHKTWRKLETQRDIAHTNPVDVLFNEQFFADVGVIRGLCARDDDDGVLRRRRRVFTAVAQHAINDAWLLAIERASAQSTCREILLGGVEHVTAAAEVDQELQREFFVHERVRDAQREVGISIVAAVGTTDEHG